ncbi:unnamed protein product [Ostreobium quekettii]|uniref:Nudix hydrolase domain-containing protein n=1 Tax=Ostreobium quekettii TaxID=121088 RepID=A0A8S1JC94_9CHLO|nr:unnamed protein product [Ostreobium quekettii]
MDPRWTKETGCPTWGFSIVICRNAQNKYLAVNETRDRGWWVPGGRLEPGEDFFQAAHRETKEEAGIDISIKGILRVEYSPMGRAGARQRVIFYAEPADESQAPKSQADEESLEARWVSVEEFMALGKLRGGELVEWGRYLDAGGAVYPREVLADEGDEVWAPTG